MSHLLLLTVLLTADSTLARWPAFLGAGANPLDAQRLATRWSPDSNIAWQADLAGEGQSSPVVWGNRVFVTSVEGPMKDRCRVTAYQLADGKQLWTRAIESSDKVESSYFVSRAAPTPAVDGNGVYAFFESGDVLALDHQGTPLWQRSLSQDYGKFQNRFGLGASVAQTEGHLFILADHEGPSYLVALKKADGSTAWKAERSPRISWSSPAVFDVDGTRQIVVSSAGAVDGYDAESGQLLWTLEDVGGNTVATPIPVDGNRFLVGASPGERGEDAEAAARSNLLVRITKGGTGWQPEVLWRAERATSSFGSPIVHRGYAYWVNRQGVVYCYDVANGELQYTERVDESCWATPLGVGDHVYFFGKDGATTVLAAGPKFQKLATNRLWNEDDAPAEDAGTREQRAARMFGGPIQYGVAAVGDSLLIRSGKKLYCVRPAGIKEKPGS